MIRVLLVDDEPLLRRSLGLAIDHTPGLRVVGEADNGVDAVVRARDRSPDIVLMDIRMPQMDGIEATRQITTDRRTARSRVIVLTMFELDEYVYGALDAGASAFLLKDAFPEQLIEAVERVHAGDSLFAPQILRRLVDHYVDQPPVARVVPRLPGLTPREQEVLTLVATGLSNTEIAAELAVTMHTVKAHIGALRAKLDVRDRAQLVIAGYTHGLVHAGGR
ncbi:DNA-binding response regulator [Tsukamurella tyrosinosolvens]|nr:DNA-binding response regulator [Tsukamurella tyrosinosolvens]